LSIRVDSAGCKEVRHLLAQISENLASGNTNDVPDVIILEDLHLASSLNDVLAPLSQLETSKVADGDDVRTPFVIGTTGPVIQQSTAQLQLQYNLRWILLANHTEPVQGLLSRFLRRRLIESELKSKTRDRELEKVVEWIPRCWAHLNRFLESHNSADVTIGPRWFLLVPADSTCSQVWFTDLWNYTLGPYLLHAAKEGLQLYGKRSPWEDPAQWVLSTYPWNQGSAYDALMR
jgi:neuron navigator 2